MYNEHRHDSSPSSPLFTPRDRMDAAARDLYIQKGVQDDMDDDELDEVSLDNLTPRQRELIKKSEIAEVGKEELLTLPLDIILDNSVLSLDLNRSTRKLEVILSYKGITLAKHTTNAISCDTLSSKERKELEMEALEYILKKRQPQTIERIAAVATNMRDPWNPRGDLGGR